MNRIQTTVRLGALDLQVDASFADEFIMVSGENGAGKTTLLRTLAGLERAQGQIVVAGNVWLDSRAEFMLSPAQRRVGCVWADAALLPWLSVEENILLGTKQMDKDWLMRLTEQLEITILMQRKPHMLSTGEMQRVALTRAIYRKPLALLLDEPFSAQAPIIRARLRKILKTIQTELQIPVIMVSHDTEDAKVLSQQHWRMREGKLLVEISRTEARQEQA